MVQATFLNLPSDKQQKVRQALLNEFSQHPLAQAQVARIVKDAGIARGAFYTYFEDLTDAYQYLYGTTLKEIHASLPLSEPLDKPDKYITAIRDFFTKADSLDYLKLFQMHSRYNEGTLGAEPSKMFEGDYGPRDWAAMTLYHQTIHDCILDPDHLEERLAQLKTVLEGSPMGGK